MNPPPALYGAMNRERKPFTYTPGGLDLSEIKSERMAKRLMRNAMNQGVPDTPVQSIRSPLASSIPVAISNFNCLPVQVFPTFQLPANPKSLLRTRSNPDRSTEPSSCDNNKSNISSRSSSNTSKPCLIPTVKNYNNKSSITNNNHNKEETDNNSIFAKSNDDDNINIIKPQITCEENNFFSVSQKEAHMDKEESCKYFTLCPDVLDYKQPLNLTMQNSTNVTTVTDYTNNNKNSTLLPTSDNNNINYLLPEISYEAEYLSTLTEEPHNSNILTDEKTKNDSLPCYLNKLSGVDFNNKKEVKDYDENISDVYNNKNNAPLSPEIYYEAESAISDKELITESKCHKNSISNDTHLKLLQAPEQNTIKEAHDNNMKQLSNSLETDSNSDEQKEIKKVKTQSEKEIKQNETENHNGDTEAAIVVKLPSKKTEAKTETDVEVLKKVLPDGSVQEITKTITKTTVDGKTEIQTTTQTKTFPKEESVEEEYEEQEEESDEIDIENAETENNIEKNVQESDESKKSDISNQKLKENTVKDDSVKNGSIITQEEKTETSTKKKVVIIQSETPESEEEEEEEEEIIEDIQEEESEIEPDVEEVVILKSKSKEETTHIKENTLEPSNTEDNMNNKTESKTLVSDEEDKEVQEEIEVDIQETGNNEINKDLEVEKKLNNEESEEEIDNDGEEQETEVIEEDIVAEKENVEKEIQQREGESEEKEETEEEFEEAEDKEVTVEESPQTIDKGTDEVLSDEKKKTDEDKETVIPIQQEIKEEVQEQIEKKDEIKPVLLPSSLKDSLREPSVPLEKVEEVEIKPIGPTQEIIKKSHTEIITTKTDSPSGALSTQTEYNVIENFVTVNRTTKTLDHAYEQAAEHTIPIIRSYIPPYNSSAQQNFKPYQSNTTETENERRHSLLLDRISVERQIPPADIYQNNYSHNNNNQAYEETQYAFEPQSEILTESNVKPSTINKNQQWYQQTKKDNIINNNISTGTCYDWTPPQQQSQPKLQKFEAQPLYQPQFAPQIQPQQQFQSSYTENTVKDTYKTVIDNNYKPNVNSYTSKPSWVSSTLDTKPINSPQSNEYSLLKNQSTETYQKSTQQFNSSYVPPPWEQDTEYMIDNRNQNVYQPPPPSNAFSPKPTQLSWQPNPEVSKYSKPPPKSYIPPAPNQSFVKPVTTAEPPKLPGRKTYYSEYERRYISVPESTYIPTETKYQAQPNPSPTYYYDNNEPAEIIEPQWRKELREFTEKTQTSTQINETSVRPPWEDDSKYGSNNLTHDNPTYNQTIRPQSWRERSYEPEYPGPKEFPKTNTLGRGRPQSSYVKNNMDRIPERPRGVSVDRYNPNSYQSPIASEHPPVQSQTLDPSIHPKPHYNPNVPGYHARASAEPREQPMYSQPRSWGESRATPIQSRSFKYLQWITGTED